MLPAGPSNGDSTTSRQRIPGCKQELVKADSLSRQDVFASELALKDPETLADRQLQEMEAYTNGVLRKLVASPGETVKVGAFLGCQVTHVPELAGQKRQTRRLL